MRLDDKEIMLLWEQGVLRSSRSTPTTKPADKLFAGFFITFGPMLRLILIVGTGSFIGGAARFLASRFFQNLTISSFPLGTFLVNIIGKFLDTKHIAMIGNSNPFHSVFHGFID